MMAYLIYNGVSTADLGVIVEKMPTEGRAAKRTSSAEPFGFDGALITDEGAYGTFNNQAVINCFGVCQPNDLHTLFSGEGWLISSNDPDRKRYIYCYGAHTVSRLRTGKCYDSVTIPFVCDPYRYEVTPEVIETSASTVITGKGDVPARPLIKMTGAGSVTLMVGGRSMIIDGLKASTPLYIDSLDKYAYVAGDDGKFISAQAAGINISMMIDADDRWFMLNNAGVTALTVVGYADLEITPRWRWF